MDEFELPIRVYYQDTDAGGVVFHGAYISFLERGRTEWLRAQGFELGRWTASHGAMLIVRRLEVSYRRPARLDDLVRVSTHVKVVGRAQFTLAQHVLRENELLVEAAVNLACVSSADLRPIALPDSLRIRLAEAAR